MLLKNYIINIAIICLLYAFSSCKETNKQIKNNIIRVPYTETAQLNIIGRWQLDSIWKLENNKRIKPSFGLLNTFWVFEENHRWRLESSPIDTKLADLDVKLESPVNNIESNYTINDSILTIKLYNLKYKILEIDTEKMYIKSIDLPYNNIHKLIFIK